MQEGLQFHFHNPGAWGYPEGLDGELTRAMEAQGLRVMAASQDGTLVYVEYRNVIWSIADNGGELAVERVNSPELIPHVAITSSVGRALPSEPYDYAVLIVVRLLAVFNGRPIDYAWRP